MGGVDKAFIKVGGVSLIERAIARARPQVGELMINANGRLDRFDEFGLNLIEDRVQGFLGPLAGIFSALDWLHANRPQAKWLASFASDCPFFPLEMVERLVTTAESENVSVAMAASAGRHHPVFAVWSTAIKGTSETVLNQGGFRKMDGFIATLPYARVEFASEPVDPFFNINTPDDVTTAEGLMVRGAANG
jgi:molybdopterin-guanine dinucleotide biosynthesis protein A